MVSFAKKDMTKGGLDQADAMIVDPKFEVENGGEYGPQIKFLCHFLPEEGDKPMGPFYYNVGKAEFWNVSNDGLELSPVDPNRKGGVSEKSGFGKLLLSMEENGLPAEVLEAGTLAAFDGLKVHLVKEDLGKTSTGKEKFTFLVTKVYAESIPKKVAKAAGKAKAKVAGSGKAAEAASTAVLEEDLTDLAMKFVVKALEALGEDEAYTTEELGQMAFSSKDFSGKTKRDVVALVSDGAWLGQKQFAKLWMYDADDDTVAKA